jgi:iron complex outermembrane receptor protein
MDPTGPSALGNDPKHQWQLRSMFNLTSKHDFDISVRHVAGLEYSTVPAFTAVDMRFGWRVTKGAELSLTLQNLFDPGHVEFGSAANGSEFGRSAFLKLLWHP